MSRVEWNPMRHRWSGFAWLRVLLCVALLGAVWCSPMRTHSPMKRPHRRTTATTYLKRSFSTCPRDSSDRPVGGESIALGNPSSENDGERGEALHGEQFVYALDFSWYPSPSRSVTHSLSFSQWLIVALRC